MGPSAAKEPLPDVGLEQHGEAPSQNLQSRSHEKFRHSRRQRDLHKICPLLLVGDRPVFEANFIRNAGDEEQKPGQTQHIVATTPLNPENNNCRTQMHAFIRYLFLPYCRFACAKKCQLCVMHVVLHHTLNTEFSIVVQQ